MSVHVSSRVWTLDLPPSEKLVLLKLADCADDQGGNAWPAVSTLARQCGNLSTRAIQKILGKLRARGMLVIQEPAGGKRKTVTYRVTVQDTPVNPGSPVNSSSPLNSRSGVNSKSRVGELQDRGTPEPQFTPSLNSSSPDPSLIRPFEPSTTAAADPNQQSASSIDEFQKSFSNLYRRHRAGATYHWTKRDSANSRELLTVYPYDDLVAMSEILLTLPSDADEWVSKSDRSVSVLSHRAVV